MFLHNSSNRMAPLVMVAVLAALAVTAAKGDVDNSGLRRGRVLNKTTEYCNSIECPNSYTPIDDAQNVACEGEEGETCGVSQCCEALCSYYACDDGFTQISNANTTVCAADSGCTAGLCCEALCSSYPCKNNFIPVEGADALLCADTGCTRSLCCEYVEDADIFLCPTSGCTKSLCCDQKRLGYDDDDDI